MSVARIPVDMALTFNGWLSPAGELIDVGLFYHEEEAFDILGQDYKPTPFESASDALTRRGWMRLHQGEWRCYRSEAITQSQLNAIWDWCGEHNRPYPDKFIEEDLI